MLEEHRITFLTTLRNPLITFGLSVQPKPQKEGESVEKHGFDVVDSEGREALDPWRRPSKLCGYFHPCFPDSGQALPAQTDPPAPKQLTLTPITSEVNVRGNLTVKVLDIPHISKRMFLG